MTKSLTILLVDDEPGIRDFVRQFLEPRITATYLEAGNADEAVEKMRLHMCDLVLLDIKMPGENGLEVIQKVLGINPDADIIMTTAYQSADIADLAIKWGAVDYITKPIELQILQSKVNKILERRGFVF